jgi:hypothetical protein
MMLLWQIGRERESEREMMEERGNDGERGNAR